MPLMRLVCLLLIAIPGSVLAAPSLATDKLDLGGDGTAVQVSVSSDGQVTVDGHGSLQMEAGLDSARIERKLSKDRPFLLVEGSRKGGRTLLLATLRNGRLVSLHNGPVGPIGRDGERAVAVEITPEEVLRYQTAPGMVRCDGDGHLFAERYEERGGFKPYPPPLPRTQAPPLHAGPAAPSGLRDRPLPVYHFIAASRQAGPAEIDRRADLLTPPRELEDGRPESAWRPGGDPRGAWVSARADGPGHAISALRLMPAPGARMPRTLAAIFADGRTWLLEVPAGKGAVWVRFPQPVRSPCISLQIVVPSQGGETGIGEVGIYSEQEDQGTIGLFRLAAGTDTALAEEASRALLLLPDDQVPEVLKALDESLPGATGEGRRRLHGVLSQVARRVPSQKAAALLLRAIGTAPAEEQPPLWAVLGELSDLAQEALLQVGQDPSQPLSIRAEALSQLGQRGSPKSVSVLLQLGEQDLPPLLRKSLVLGLKAATRCLPADEPRISALLQALEHTWQTDPIRLQRAADLLEVIAAGALGCPDPGPRDRAEKILVTSWQHLKSTPPERPDAFVARYRVLQGLAQLSATTEDAAALLKEVLWQGRDPVLREAAARAATTLPVPRHGEITRRGLSDPDPGVRLTSLLSLSGRRDAATVVAIEQALGGDRWPQVRRAAIEARAASCPQPAGAGPRVLMLRRALHDPDDEVRRRALLAVARCEGTGALALLADTARNSDIPPGLRGLSCSLSASIGGRSSQKVLSEALIDALQDPLADERQVGVVMPCARALGKVGGPLALKALVQAAGEPLSAQVRLAGIEGLDLLCSQPDTRAGPRLTEALRTAAKDADGRVRTAAAAAARHCHLP